MVAILSYSMIGAMRAGRVFAHLGMGLIRGLAAAGRAVQNRRVAASLAGLDDHMLADIGLTRSDLRDAYSEPLWHDPTDVLAARAAERRARRPVDDTPKLPWTCCETVGCR